MYQSDIRDSTKRLLLEKVQKQNYGKYLSKIGLSRIRGFENQFIKFDFPVTALIGPNGGGKTTILGAAGCAYKDIKPRLFFTRSGSLDKSMQNWRIEYEIIDRKLAERDIVKRTATFGNFKWSRDALEREIVVFGVSRTVPVTERVELRKYGSTSLEVKDGDAKLLTSEVAKAVAKILSKDTSGYTHISIDPRGRVSLLAGKTDEGVQYSEFHFGAGESSVIRMVMRIEALSENALILIEEIENGLHPIATTRMVEYLIDLAERKKIQVVFTTHSNDALLPLPDQAIWSSFQGKVIQGKLDIHALRTITGQIKAQLAIFTEDSFAADWVKALLNAYGGIAVDLIEVHALSGDGTAVKINEAHNQDPSNKFPSACFIDGDSRQIESTEKKVFRLPGECPETFIYNTVLDHLDEYIGIMSVALHRPYEDHSRIRGILHKLKITNGDPHNIYSQVGKNLGLIPESVVRSAFLNIWTQMYPEKVKEMLSNIHSLLPHEHTGFVEEQGLFANI